MRPKTIIVGPRIVFGIVVPAHSGITYRTRGSPVEIGPLHSETTKSHSIPRPSERSCCSSWTPRMPDGRNREGDISRADIRSKDCGNDSEATPFSAYHVSVKRTRERRRAMSSR
jgi:hypothetical protein